MSGTGVVSRRLGSAPPDAPVGPPPVAPAQPASPGRPSGRSAPGTATYVAIDLAAVAVAAVVAHLIRFGTSSASVPGAAIPYTAVALLALPVWLGVLAVAGCYDRRVLGTGTDEYHRVLNGGLHFLAVVALLHMLGSLVIARGFVAVLIPVALTLTLLARWRQRSWLYAQRRRGRYVRRLLLVGAPSTVVDVGQHLVRSRWAGYELVGACIDGAARPVAAGANGHGAAGHAGALGTAGFVEVAGQPVPVVGRVDDVGAAIAACGADAVAVTDESTAAELRAIAQVVDQPGIDLLVAPAIAEVAGPRTLLRPVAELALLHVAEPCFTGPRVAAKAVIDRLGATLCLLALSPLLAAIAVAIRRDSPGPVLFRQERVGRDGRRFTMVKFRTMVVEAEAMLEALEHSNEADGVLFKMRSDPRVTRVGRLLRRASLDELPQLWNVVRGEMSLVGPRPPLPGEVDLYEGPVGRRLLVKPGMTGLWQVSGRSDLSWEESIRLDLHYVDHWSPTMDAMIVAKTLTAVLKGSGAY